MTKILNTDAYQIKENIVITDYFIGTDSETEKLETVNFTAEGIRKYVVAGLTPETGGTLKITEISYTGPTYTKASELINALDPSYAVLRYHLVFASVNGEKSLLKQQNVMVGLIETPVVDADFITITEAATDGSETKLTQGTNITITGSGTTASPYVISAAATSAPDATTTVKGIVKLTGDFGGTADAPTTPTAVHITTNETITGTKTFNKTGTVANIISNNSAGGDGIKSNNTSIGYGINSSNSSTGRGIMSSNSSTGNGIFSDNSGTGAGIISFNNSTGRGISSVNSSTGRGIDAGNDSTGTAIFSENASSGNGIVSNGTILATGFNYVGQNNNVDTFTVDKLGNVIANSFTKTSGTAFQRLLTNGDVEDTNKQKVISYPADFTGTNYTLTDADNNYEIIINNAATAVTITVPSGLLSKIGIGFTQKGTGDITFVASGTTINNPIGLKSKGQYYQTYLSQEAATNTFYLGGSTKV